MGGSQRWQDVDDFIVGVLINSTAPDYTNLQNIFDRIRSWTHDNYVTRNTNKAVVVQFNTTSVILLLPLIISSIYLLQAGE